jgi:hypothetical protein
VTNALKRKLKETKYLVENADGEWETRKLPEGMTLRDALVNVAYSRAIAGDQFFYREIMERVEGRVPQRHAQADGSNLPAAITVVEVIAPQVTVQAPPRVIEIATPEGS